MKKEVKILLIAIGLGLLASMSCTPGHINTPVSCTPGHINTPVKPGDLFYVRWGYPDGIRKYRCVDTNKNGAFVKWCDAQECDNSAVEFMPNPQDQITFKLILK